MKYANLIELNGEIILDLTKDTISADKLAYGITAYDANGQPIVGVASIGGNTIDLSSATVALGEDGKVYAFVNGQLVGVGVAVEDLKAPEGEDEPDTPVATSLAPGMYSTGTLRAYTEGTLDIATTAPSKTWQQLLDEGVISVQDGYLCADYASFEGELVVADGVTKIGSFDYNCYMDFNLYGMFIPSSVTKIYGGAFDSQYITTLVIAENSNLANIGESIFANNSGSDAIRIVYNGTSEQWNAITKDNTWADNAGYNGLSVYCEADDTTINVH